MLSSYHKDQRTYLPFPTAKPPSVISRKPLGVIHLHRKNSSDMASWHPHNSLLPANHIASAGIAVADILQDPHGAGYSGLLAIFVCVQVFLMWFHGCPGCWGSYTVAWILNYKVLTVVWLLYRVIFSLICLNNLNMPFASKEQSRHSQIIIWGQKDFVTSLR